MNREIADARAPAIPESFATLWEQGADLIINKEMRINDAFMSVAIEERECVPTAEVLERHPLGRRRQSGSPPTGLTVVRLKPA